MADAKLFQRNKLQEYVPPSSAVEVGVGLTREWGRPNARASSSQADWTRRARYRLRDELQADKKDKNFNRRKTVLKRVVRPSPRSVVGRYWRPAKTLCSFVFTKRD